MGRFLLGSTFVILFGQDIIDFNDNWGLARPVCLGELMGNGPAR